MSFYNKQDLLRGFKRIGLKQGDSIYITGNIALFGPYTNLKSICKDYYDCILNIIDKQGTITFPTHTFREIKKKNFFCKDTQSETGTLTEYLRKKKKSIRQMHPFSSVTSLGKCASYICKNNSLNAYGPDSPWEKMIKLNTKFISLGLHPRFTSSNVHHVEFLANVPYRYNKEFIKKIKINNKVHKKGYYLFVMYQNVKNMIKDQNKKIFINFLKKNKILKTKLGRSNIYSYSMKDFHYISLKLMLRRPFVYLRHENISGPWNS